MLIGLACMMLAGVAHSQPQRPTPGLLTNGGFEAPLGPDGQPSGFRIGPIDSRTAARGSFELVPDAHGGRQALKITRTNADRGYALNVLTSAFEPTSPSRRLAVVGWIKTIGDRRRGRAPWLELQAFTPAWVGACRVLQATEASPYAEGWAKQCVLLEQMSGATLKYLRFLVDVSRPGDGLIIDDVALYDVTTWPQRDIDVLMKSAQHDTPEAVVDTQPTRKGNLLENSSFELGLSRGWSILGLLPERQRRSIDRDVARYGHVSVRLDYGPNGRATLVSKFRPVRVHQTHTLSAWVRSSTVDATVTIGFENGYVPRGGQPRCCRITKKLPANTWQRISVTGTTEPGPQNAYAVRISASGSTRGSVWVDAVQLEEGPTSGYRPRRQIEAALAPVDPTGISDWDEPVRYVVRIANAGDRQDRLTLRIETTDFWHRPARQTPIGPKTIPPGVTTIARSARPAVRGSQRVKLWIEGRTEPEDEITLTVVPKPRYPGRHPDSRFGQHVRLEPWQLGVAKRLGANWVRLHDVSRDLSWDQVEPNPGQWVWADDKIDAAHRAGLEVLGVLGRAPAWAVIDEQGRRPSHGGWYYPDDLKAWGRYVEAVTRHYRGKVDVWEIWNEPYHGGFGIGDGTKYAALAKIAYAAAKRGNPDSTILGLCTHEGMLPFNVAAIRGGAMQACDLVSYHAYTGLGPDVYGRTRMLRETLGLDRSGKRFWMTEGMGGYTHTWHSLLIDAVDDSYSRRPGAPKFASEQAALTGALAIAGILVAGADKTFWYWSPWEGAGSIRPDRYTWFEYDGQLKPYAAAYAVAAHFLDGTRSVKRIETSRHLIACLFECNNDAVAVLWCKKENQTSMALPTAETQPSRAIAAFDMMGNRLTARDGHVPVGRHPVYIVAGNRRAAALIPLLGLE